MTLAILAVFFAGMVLGGFLFAYKSEPMQIASNDATPAIPFRTVRRQPRGTNFLGSLFRSGLKCLEPLENGHVWNMSATTPLRGEKRRSELCQENA
jgi:hypothetical protein